MDRAKETQVGNVVTAALRHRHDVVDLQQVGRATGHSGERVPVAAGSTVPPPHRAPYRRRNVPPRAPRAGGFSCWRPPCRAALGQPRTHPAVRLSVGPRTNIPCLRRDLVLRRTAGECGAGAGSGRSGGGKASISQSGGVLRSLIGPAAGYRWRELVLRRTTGKCAAGAGSGRSGGGKAGISRAGGMLRSPIGPVVGYRRRSLVLRRTAGECAAGAGSVRSGGGKASISPADGVLRSPIGPAAGYRRRLLVLRRTAGECAAGAGSGRTGSADAGSSQAGGGRSRSGKSGGSRTKCRGKGSNRTGGDRTAGSLGRGHALTKRTGGASRRACLGDPGAQRTSGSPAFVAHDTMLLAPLGVPCRGRRSALRATPLAQRVVLPLRLLQQVGEQLPGSEPRVHV